MGEKIDQAKGRAKQAAGDLTGDDDLAREGKGDELLGKAKGVLDDLRGKADEAMERVKGKVDDARR
jgi:uncharacterized protein YjbJ (UPF0337 family)